MAKSVSLYLQSDVEEEIQKRDENRSLIINRDLERLYTLYDRALKEVTLTVDEACLITDRLKGVLSDAATAMMLWASVEDAIRLDHLDKKWEVDGPALVEKLKNITPFQSMALVDAAERFWNIPPGKVGTRDGVKECFKNK